MKIAFTLIILTCLFNPGFSQEDSIKTSHEKFYHPVTRTEAPEEVAVKKEAPDIKTPDAPKAKIEPKKIRSKKAVARKE